MVSIERLRKWLSVALGISVTVALLTFGVSFLFRINPPKPGNAAPASTAVPPAGSLDSLVEGGDRLLAQRKAEQAIVTYREALARKPDLPEAQFGLAMGELLAGRDEVATAEFERLLQLHPQHRGGLIQLARIYSQRPKTWSRAAGLFDRYLQQSPADWTAQLGMARVLAWSGEVKRAAEIFDRPEVASLMAPSDKRDYVFCLMRLNRHQDAEPVLKSLLSQNPRDIELTLQLASLYAARGDWPSALPRYRAALEARPGDPKINLNYGMGLLSGKHYKEALPPLGKAVSALPNNAEAGLAYARAWKGAGDLKKSSEHFKRVLPNYLTNAQIVREYADLMIERKKYGEAAKHYRIAESRGLRDDRLIVGMAGALMGARKYKEALPYLQEAYKQNPTTRRAYDLARAYSRTGQKQEAMAMLARIESASLPARDED